MATDAQIKAAFAKDVQRILKEIYKLEADAIKQALDLLKDVRQDLLLSMANTNASEFSMSVYRQLKTSIEYRIAGFERDLANAMNLDLSKSFDLGVKLADEPLAKAFNLSFIGMSREAVLVASQYSADLIQSLSNGAKESINSVLRRASLGSLTIPEAIKLVGKNIDQGAFKSIAARAETIVRTEVLRINSMAAHARMVANKDAANDYGYSTLRAWSSTIDLRVRPSHLLANGQLRTVEDPFLVGGAELLYPRDPEGPAEETINCRCSAVSTLVLSSEYESMLAQSHLAA
jgi:hypothetical protein